MANPIIRIHNSTTNEVVDREMTDVEFVQYQAEKTKAVADEAAQTVKDAKRQTVLNKLGLTADEAQTLFG